MSHDTVQRVRVWSGAVRTLHWAMALCVGTLIGSGWLLQRCGTDLGPDPAEVHRNVGLLLLAALAARSYLLFFGRGAEHWRDFIPWPPQHRAALEMMRFYLTLGRAPLPAYYAHNPLWGPIYLAFFVFVALQGLSGLTGELSVHALGLPVAVGFALAHVLAAFVHDWRGQGADVSALINGHRIFVVRHPERAGVHVVSADSLRAPRQRPGR
jgi:Ni/Fe-hydrogenase 1 B-type cytochrome subunit